jgi:hypothetical protein
MARIFDIIPVGTTKLKIQSDGGSVQRDLGVMYDIGEDAEQALDLILEPYGQIGGFYLDNTQAWDFPVNANFDEFSESELVLMALVCHSLCAHENREI